MRYGTGTLNVLKMVRMHPCRPLTFSVCTALCLISASTSRNRDPAFENKLTRSGIPGLERKSCHPIKLARPCCTSQLQSGLLAHDDCLYPFVIALKHLRWSRAVVEVGSLLKEPCHE